MGVSSCCWGQAGQEGAVKVLFINCLFCLELCKDKHEPEQEVNASPGAVISALPGWGPGLPSPAPSS